MKYVDWCLDFLDGDIFYILQIVDVIIDDYVEDILIIYNVFGINDFILIIDKYKLSVYYIICKMMQDSYYMNELVLFFVFK